MATLSAATAASLLVGLMAIAPRPGSGATTPVRPGSMPDHGRHDTPRRLASPAAVPRPARPCSPQPGPGRP